MEVPAHSLERLGRLIGAEREAALREAAGSALQSLDGVRIWNISSTAHGGGVAEMLKLLCGYANDAGADTRWLVIDADPEFFAITKRLHNRIHGAAGDDGDLGPREAAHYHAVLAANVDAIDGRIRRDDIVVLHDPQTAGLANHLIGYGVHVAWRCHIGSDRTNTFTEEAWSFLQPHLAHCRTFVFSHAAFVPARLAGADVWIIEPSIDPLSAKNRPLSRARVGEPLGEDRVARGRRVGAHPGRDGGRGTVLARRPPGRPGFALGPPEGHARACSAASPSTWPDGATRASL